MIDWRELLERYESSVEVAETVCARTGIRGDPADRLLFTNRGAVRNAHGGRAMREALPALIASLASDPRPVNTESVGGAIGLFAHPHLRLIPLLVSIGLVHPEHIAYLTTAELSGQTGPGLRKAYLAGKAADPQEAHYGEPIGVHGIARRVSVRERYIGLVMVDTVSEQVAVQALAPALRHTIDDETYPPDARPVDAEGRSVPMPQHVERLHPREVVQDQLDDRRLACAIIGACELDAAAGVAAGRRLPVLLDRLPIGWWERDAAGRWHPGRDDRLAPTVTSDADGTGPVAALAWTLSRTVDRPLDETALASLRYGEDDLDVFIARLLGGTIRSEYVVGAHSSVFDGFSLAGTPVSLLVHHDPPAWSAWVVRSDLAVRDISLLSVAIEHHLNQGRDDVAAAVASVDETFKVLRSEASLRGTRAAVCSLGLAAAITRLSS